MWLQNDRQDGTVRSPLYRPIPPDVPTYIIYTRPSWRASWQLETESNSNPRPDSVRHSVSSQRSVGQKWQRGSRSQIYSCTYERIYIYIYMWVRMIPQPMPPLLAVVSFGEGPLGGEPAGSNRNYIFKVFSCTLLGALIFSYFYNFN